MIQAIVIGQSSAVQLSLNGSEDLQISNSFSYNNQLNPSSLSFQSNIPIVCSSVSSSQEPIVIDISDSNGIPMNTQNNGIISAVYDLNQNTIRIGTDMSVKCATETGMHNEVILSTGFENLHDLEITLLDGNGDPFVEIVQIADQQVFNYQYIVSNNSTNQAVANIEEFYNLLGNHPFFSGVGGADWSCTPINTAQGSSTDCVVSSGNDIVSIQNAVIDAGEQLLIEVSRTVEVPNGTVGQDIELLAAVFNKNSVDTSPNNNVSFRTLATTTNVAPTITFDVMPAFDEDTSSSIVGFTVSDPNMNPADIVVTAESLNTSVIPGNSDGPNINLIDNGAGNWSIQLIPNADANTQTSSASIRITADDGITTTTENFPVTINPINDEPTFDFMCVDNIVDSLTGQVTCNDGNTPEAIQINDFITNIEYGNPGDLFENLVQKTDEYIITIENDTSGIIHSDIGGHSVSIDPQTNKLEFSLNNNVYGTATIGVQLRDDGGTANGGVDLSVKKTFTITVPVPEYQFVATVNNLPSFQGFSVRLESGQQSYAFVGIGADGVYDIGQLVQGSDYIISIEAESAGAIACVIVSSNDGTIGGQGKTLDGTALSQDVNFTVDCTPTPQ